MKKNILTIFVVLACVITAGAGTVLMTACFDNPAKQKPVSEPEPIINPLTGATEEEGFDADALNRRVVAFVVENTPDARPQWGMDDPDCSPDIILEGEVEGGITRTLWLYADMNKLPEQIGPMRSARPPFIRFSEFWDAIFIHWGQSHSKGEYVGANEVFKTDIVDHINQMHFEDKSGLYGRDRSRGVSSEHTGIVHGDRVPAAIDEYGCRKKPKEYTRLEFNEKAEPMSDKRADEVSVNFSTRTDWETKKWTYDPEDGLYHTDNFKNKLTRENLLILNDKTEYITKENYEGPGGASSVTYCDYALGGGTGKLISEGTVKDIQWKKKGGRLLLIDTAATEAEQAKVDAENEGKDPEDQVKARPVVAKLNPGKTWIGWISSNNGGNFEIIAHDQGESSDDAGSNSGDSSGE